MLIPIIVLYFLHQGLTLATLPDLTRVEAGQLVATVKVIPYGLAGEVVRQGVSALGERPKTRTRARVRFARTSPRGSSDGRIAASAELRRSKSEALASKYASLPP